jgi:hypothetical protein
MGIGLAAATQRCTFNRALGTRPTLKRDSPEHLVDGESGSKSNAAGNYSSRAVPMMDTIWFPLLHSTPHTPMGVGCAGLCRVHRSRQRAKATAAPVVGASARGETYA